MGTHHGHVPKSSLRSRTWASLEAVSVKVVGRWQWSQHHSNQAATKNHGRFVSIVFSKKVRCRKLPVFEKHGGDWLNRIARNVLLWCRWKYQKSTEPYGPLSSLGRSFNVNLGWRDEIAFGNLNNVVPRWVGPFQSLSKHIWASNVIPSHLERSLLFFTGNHLSNLLWSLMVCFENLPLAADDFLLPSWTFIMFGNYIK